MSISVTIIGLSLSNYNFEENNSDVKSIVQADVIMPTKSSRPGDWEDDPDYCKKTDRCYIPSVIIIDSGNQVTWFNDDSSFHSITSGFYDEPTGLFDSGILDPYQFYTLYFDESGIYDYFCTLHPWMKAQVIVE